MTKPGLTYCVRQAIPIGMAVGIGCFFVAAVAFGAQLLHGLSLERALHFAIFTFSWMFIFGWVGLTTLTIMKIRAKVAKAGYSLDYLGSLGEEERRAFQSRFDI